MIAELKDNVREKPIGVTTISGDNPIPQVEDVKFNERMLYPESLHPSFPAIGNIEYTELENFEGLADIVVKKSFEANISKDPIEFDGIKDEKSDPSAKIRDFLEESTAFVNREFFKSPEVNVKFLKTVYNGINDALNRYKELKNINPDDIQLIYKGGNALRAVYAGFIRSLPINISEKIEKTFKDYFKKSDSDFGILIRPSVANWDKVFIDVQKLVYLCINKLRNIFMMNLDTFFDFYKLNSYVKKKLLLIQLDAMNKSKNVGKVGYPKRFENMKYMNLTVGLPINFSEITEDMIINDDKVKNDWNRYHADAYRPDIYMNSKVNDEMGYKMLRVHKIDKIHTPHYKHLHSDKAVKTDVKLQKIMYNNNPNNEMYISWNSDIEFSSQAFGDIEKNISKFCLIRMKTNFIYYYTDANNKYGLLNIPGELIDVSISHKLSTEMNKFDYDENRDITMFTYVDDDKLKFKGYTYSYYLKDMNKMVLYETNLPWEIPKYEKRIKRLFFIYTMVFIRHMFLIRDSKDVVDLLEKIVNNIKETLTYPIVIETVDKQLKEIARDIDTYKEKLNELEDKETLDNISILFSLTAKKISHFKTKVDEKEAKDFLTKLRTYGEELLSTCKELKQYIDDPTAVLKKQVDYDNIVTQVRGLAGGAKEHPIYKKYREYRLKYKKYKNKYRKTLNVRK